MPDPLDDLLGMPPLDLGETMAPQSPPPSQPSARSRAKDFAPLLALLPIVAAKGGQAGVAALLHGFQQSRQQGEATARQTQQDTERQRQVAEQERIRRATLAQNTANDAAMRRQQFMSTFQNGLQSEALDSPEAVRAFMEFYRPQAQALGLRPDAMDAITMEAMTPSRFEKKEATKVIGDLKKNYPENFVNMTAVLKDGTKANWEELNRRAGFEGPRPEPKVDVPNTSEEQHIADVIAIEEERIGRPLSRSERAQARLKAVHAFRDAGRADAPVQPAGTLPPKVQAVVTAQSRGWDSLPIVKTTQKMAEAVSFADSLDPNTKNPADDQALIYAFAKAMDPDSVVREGEYATVQKYAQSWAESFGFNAARILSNTAFLTPQARVNMKKTIRARFLAGKNQYDNVRRSYASKINKATGKQDGEDYLTDYAGGFPTNEPAAPPPAAPAAPVPPRVNPFRR